MTDLDRARKAADLVANMVDAFDELTNEYWHEDNSNGHGLNQLNKELDRAQSVAIKELHFAEQAALRELTTRKDVDNG